MESIFLRNYRVDGLGVEDGTYGVGYGHNAWIGSPMVRSSTDKYMGLVSAAMIICILMGARCGEMMGMTYD